MIIVKISGGIGNQMFQYAIGKHLAIKYNTRLKLDLRFFQKQTLRNFDLNVFPIKEEIISTKELDLYFPDPSFNRFKNYWKRIIKKRYGYKMILEKKFNFQPEILSAGKNVYLDGYWQSEKYFEAVGPEIRKCFQFRNEQDSYDKQLIQKIQQSNSVSVHFRLGDYIKNETTNQVHGVCSPDYYLKALSFISDKIKDPVFFIFSDDIPWVKNNFHFSREHFYIEGNAYHSYKDMQLMSFCKHNIIANSSFSWWGAWLNDYPEKMVIAPFKWFNISDRNTNDLIPESWIKIT